MPLVDIIEDKDERTSPERAGIEVGVPGSDELSREVPILIRKGQHLDVDAVLARSLPNPGAFSIKDVKTIGLR